MDWQDELRNLDTKLSDGTISPTEYRKLRDQVLAEASSGGPVHRPVGPQQHDEAEQQRVHIPASAAAEAPSGEMTQVVDVQTATADAENTVVVGAEEATRPATRTVAQELAEPAFAPPPPPPPWETPHAAPVPPVQGEDVFAVVHKKDRSGRRAALSSLAVLVVLALIGAGVWWFVLRDDTQAAAGGGSDSPGVSVPGPAPDDVEAKLPELTGQQSPNNSTMSLDRAVQLKLFPQTEADAFKAAGATEVVYRAASQDGIGISVFVVPSTKPGAGSKAMRDSTATLGFKDAELGLPGKPATAQVSDKQARYVSAVYDSGQLSVQVLGTQLLAGDPKALSARMSSVLTGLIKTLPPR
jgi:hypothetical protein